MKNLLDDRLTVPQAAELLGLGYSTVARMVQHGELDAIRIGRRRGVYRVSKKSVMDYVNQRLQKEKERKRATGRARRERLATA